MRLSCELLIMFALAGASSMYYVGAWAQGVYKGHCRCTAWQLCMCLWVHGCMGVWVYVWAHGRMGVWVYGCMGVCVHGRIGVWVCGCIRVCLALRTWAM